MGMKAAGRRDEERREGAVPGGGEEEIAAYHLGPAQRRKAKPNGWTKARRAAFLTELAHSCNVSRAHKAAEMGERSAYTLRQRDPGFARQWQEALELGYTRLELALARRALEVLGELELDTRAEPVVPMTVAQAIEVMNLHRRSVQQGRAHQRRSPHVATQEETDAVLIKKIAMIKRQRAIRATPRTAGTAGTPQPRGDDGADRGA